MNDPVLTIDGPSGAGKGTVSRVIANQKGWHYLDSGSIYRSLAIAVLDQSVNLESKAEIVQLAKNMTLEFSGVEVLAVQLNGVDITARLATETTGSIASQIAVIPEVRAVLLQKQRDFRRAPGLVADGRDMGTVVFSEANYKVFLTASAEKRALRRYKQLIEKGFNANLAQITQDIESRDLRDSQRAIAPLALAEGALYVDSTDKTAEQVIAVILSFMLRVYQADHKCT
ncbi:MAG TPA: (d)CMP kinase [Methylococcaceae bacterium]|jgi:cytidylate kinase|nr:(d)CMP kinase [Methylococcaceae bacterium]HIA44889.1 (d)CMP kinase [Methylococcaceae bacterium]HIN69035.1 (d)CMP kinase [Methylococcales bacterium]HIO44049.1 (d)CMP kinase [Methylococcales bacterium]